MNVIPGFETLPLEDGETCLICAWGGRGPNVPATHVFRDVQGPRGRIALCTRCWTLTTDAILRNETGGCAEGTKHSSGGEDA